jgi:hypothetical protein
MLHAALQHAMMGEYANALRVAFAGVLVACSSPSVTVPDANAKLLGVVDAGAVPAPSVIQLPAKAYPYRVVPVRGVAAQAVAVVMDINHAADPVAAPVSRLDGSYCTEIDLVEPADYDIAVTSEASDGRTSSSQGHLKFVYDPNAPDQPEVTLCQGQRPPR